MTPALSIVLIYVRDVARTVTFYCTFFGLERVEGPDEGVVELRAPGGGASLLIHRAAKSVKLGQVAVKPVFVVADVEAFKARAAKQDKVFGSTHRGDGYVFANAEDPDKNSVSISSRAFRPDRER